MSEKSNIAERIILFMVFFVFAVLLVVFVFGWDAITGTGSTSSGTPSELQYVTSSKNDTVLSSEPIVSQDEKKEGLLNINTATAAELDALPGIGEKKAQAIVDYRAENGPFSSIDGIKEVKGIGDGIFEQIKDLITVN